MPSLSRKNFQFLLVFLFELLLLLLFTQSFFDHLPSRTSFQKTKWVYFFLSFLPLLGALFPSFGLKEKKHRFSEAFVWLTCFPLFFFYLTSPLLLTSKDTHPAKLLPFALDQKGSFTLDEYLPPSSMGFSSEVYYVIPTPEGSMSSYPILPGIANYPILKLVQRMGVQTPFSSFSIDDILTRDTIFVYYLEKFGSAFYACLASGFLFSYLNRTRVWKISLSAWAIFSLGLSHYSQSSQTLWQHGFVELSLLLFLWTFQRLDSHKAFSFFFLGLMSWARPNALLLTPFLFLFTIQKNKNPILSLFTLAVSLGFFSLCNYLLYENILGGYPKYMELSMGSANYYNALPELVRAFFGLWFSPIFGLFWFSPILLLIIFNKKIFSSSITILFIGFCVYTLFYSFYPIWWGGFSYGNRFLTDTNPILVLLCTSGLRYFLRTKLYHKIIVLFFFLLSFYIQNLPTRNLNAFNGYFIQFPGADWGERAFHFRDSPWFVEFGWLQKEPK